MPLWSGSSRLASVSPEEPWNLTPTIAANPLPQATNYRPGMRPNSISSRVDVAYGDKPNPDDTAFTTTALAMFGPPRRPLLSVDQIVSDIIILPYRNWADQGNYGHETFRERMNYRYQFRRNPIFHAAVHGSTANVAGSDVTVLPNKRGPKKLCNEIADFVNWTISSSAAGWVGLFDNIIATAKIDGMTVNVKKLMPVPWKGQTLWGLDHVRQLDTVFIRLQLDVYRNVIAIVNTVRGLEYYPAQDVILYSHNMQYSDPFGIPDATCVAGTNGMAELWQAAFMAWKIAVEVYGLPYMKGKYGEAARAGALKQAIQGLRAGGWINIHKDDDVEIMNMAAAAGSGMFKEMVDASSEAMFIGTRGSAQPFMEGGGGQDSHTDTEVQRDSSDAWTHHELKHCAKCVEYQLFPWLVGCNWGNDPDLVPTLKLGGVNWKETKTICEVITDIKEKVGLKPSRDWVENILGIPEERDENDSFGPVEEEEQENTAVVQAVAGIIAQVTAGAIPVEAARALLMLEFEYPADWVVKLIPDLPPKPPALPAPQGQPQQTEPASPQMFSADAEPESWEREAEKMLADYRGSAA